MTKEELQAMTTDELIKRYDIIRVDDKVAVRNTFLMKKDNMFDELKGRKSEILERIIEIENEKKQAFEERKRKISEIEGLKEIKDAMDDIASWHYEFNKSFEGDCGGMGVRAKPDYDIKSMRAKYPRADAYLKAEAEANKHNHQLSAIGKRALEKIINDPTGYEQAIKQMNKEIKDFTEEHLFD